jgi:predicted outer membrane repeat protein
MDRKHTSSKVLGGAIKARSITKIEKCKFIKNHADSYGGAIHVDGNEIIINSIFIENSAPYGGAIFAKNDQSYLINNNFIGNNNKYTDGDLGAAIQGQGIFINNIFDQNYKDITIIESTSKIYNNYIDMVKVVNYNNESIIIDKNNLEPYYDGELYLNDDNITLQADSPVIDKGLNPSSSTFRDLIDNDEVYKIIQNELTSDILENNRIHNSTIDMGVSEFNSAK